MRRAGYAPSRPCARLGRPGGRPVAAAGRPTDNARRGSAPGTGAPGTTARAGPGARDGSAVRGAERSSRVPGLHSRASPPGRPRCADLTARGQPVLRRVDGAPVRPQVDLGGHRLVFRGFLGSAGRHLGACWSNVCSVAPPYFASRVSPSRAFLSVSRLRGVLSDAAHSSLARTACDGMLPHQVRVMPTDDRLAGSSGYRHRAVRRHTGARAESRSPCAPAPARPTRHVRSPGRLGRCLCRERLLAATSTRPTGLRRLTPPPPANFRSALSCSVSPNVPL